ncbi:MAG: AAA family ATPase [Patescibacteria group bacterium]
MNKSSTINDSSERITSLYESTLEIPKNKPKNQFVLCPIGLVGAGKTTVISPLSKKLSLLRISTDEIRILFKKDGLDWGQAREIAYGLVKKYLHQGFSVAVDIDCVTERARNYIAEAQKELDLKVIWIHINPPEEFIINKLKDYKHDGVLFKDAEDAINNYFDRKPLHQNLDFPFTYTFDTSKSNLDEQINEAVDKINDLIK